MKDLYELKNLYSEATEYLVSSLTPVKQSELKASQWKIYPFIAQVGKYYETSKNRILFIGKATNGWVNPLQYDGTQQSIKSFYDNTAFNPDSEDRLVHRDDEMQWVENLVGNTEGYNTNRSHFWNFIRKVSERMEVTYNWSSKIAWSNLYKFAPEKGNPNGELRKHQADYCWKILDYEIEILQPKCVVFLTSNWQCEYLKQRYSVMPQTTCTAFGRDSKFEIFYFFDNNTLFISTKHPQGKPIQEHADKICKIIRDSK